MSVYNCTIKTLDDLTSLLQYFPPDHACIDLKATNVDIITIILYLNTLLMVYYSVLPLYFKHEFLFIKAINKLRKTC